MESSGLLEFSVKARDSVRERGPSLHGEQRSSTMLSSGWGTMVLCLHDGGSCARLALSGSDLEISLPLAQNDRLPDLYVPTCPAVNSIRCALLMT